jgi:hypothetical protein
MKNIHVLATDEPSKLFRSFGKLKIEDYITERENSQLQNQNIHITNDEKIKEGDWVYCNREGFEPVLKQKVNTMGVNNDPSMKKIILTTDADLIKDGVQAIDDEFLEWFVKNPSCESIEVEYGDDGNGYIPILPQETLEEAIDGYVYKNSNKENLPDILTNAIRFGAKWQEQQTIEEVFEWLTTNNYLTDLKETLIENFKNK